MPNVAFRDAAIRFIDLVIQQAGEIERALFDDACSEDLRGRRKAAALQASSSGIGYRVPDGEMDRLYADFNFWPDQEEGMFVEALGAVNAQLCGTNSPETALVNAVVDSHRAYLLCAREASYESRTHCDLRVCLQHQNNIAALKIAVGYIASAEAEAVTDKSLGGEQQHATGVKKQRRRRRQNPQPKPLTPRQTEAMKHHGDCQGKIAEIARRMGVARKTAEQHVKAAFTKLGQSVPKKVKTTSHKKDRRGQENVAASDDHRG